MLEDRQKQLLFDYMKTSIYHSSCGYVFGPTIMDNHRRMYSIFDTLEVGYCVEYRGKKDRIGAWQQKDGFCLFVTFKQATKLLQYLSTETGSTFDEITDGKFKAFIGKSSNLIMPDFKKAKEEAKAVGRPRTQRESDDIRAVDDIPRVEIDWRSLKGDKNGMANLHGSR